ncbi:MAG: ArsI/CadI family heavy metal resistance metalloenzyme [Planctomycetota bacterium]
MTTNTMHVALEVADLARSTAFYGALFGLPAAKEHDDYAKFEVADPPLILSLQPARGDVARGALSHMGVRLPSAADLLAARERLEAAGVDLREEPMTTCCYAVQDKLWATDPDGNPWEFYVLLEDADVHSEPATECCASDASCCP